MPAKHPRHSSNGRGLGYHRDCFRRLDSARLPAGCNRVGSMRSAATTVRPVCGDLALVDRHCSTGLLLYGVAPLQLNVSTCFADVRGAHPRSRGGSRAAAHRRVKSRYLSYQNDSPLISPRSRKGKQPQASAVDVFSSRRNESDSAARHVDPEIEFLNNLTLENNALRRRCVSLCVRGCNTVCPAASPHCCADTAAQLLAKRRSRACSSAGPRVSWAVC